MRNKQVFFLFILSLVMSAGILLFAMLRIGICPGYIGAGRFCIFESSSMLITLILFLSTINIPVFLTLLFVPKIIFNTWKKFAVIYLPIATLLIIIPDDCGFICFDDIIPVLLGAIYVIVSLVIIIKKTIKLRKEKTALIKKKP